MKPINLAAILDKADALRRKRQQAIDLADQFLRSMFLDTVGPQAIGIEQWEELTIEEFAVEEKGAPLVALYIPYQGLWIFQPIKPTFEWEDHV